MTKELKPIDINNPYNDPNITIVCWECGRETITSTSTFATGCMRCCNCGSGDLYKKDKNND